MTAVRLLSAVTPAKRAFTSRSEGASGRVEAAAEVATKPTERVKLASVEVERLSTFSRSRGVLKVRPAAAFQLPSMFSGRVKRRPVTSS